MESKFTEKTDEILENNNENEQIEIEFKKLNRKKNINSILFLILLSLINVGLIFIILNLK